MDSVSAPNHTQRPKRSRVLLSCAPCRASKLKCDRAQPCTQCTKKDRADSCTYAPKPEKKRKTKGVAARLKRLEGMIEELRDHFDDSASDTDEDLPAASEDDPPLLALATMLPKDRRDRQYLLDNLPEKHVMDRLISRYFASLTPVQHIIHRPSFIKAYTQFCQDESTASFHWLAQLFMILTMGVLFNSYSNPAETQADSPLTVHERVKIFRQCAGWALVWGKFTQPTFATLPAFLLYEEAQFVLSCAGQMESYILSGVMMRLMLKMGLHRDPSQMPSITSFEGEMRRRLWNMAIQLETVISFHMGLPSMIASVDADVEVPRNYRDEDLDESSADLPPERPHSEFTALIYPIYKTRILRVFDDIARQVHSPRPPSYADVRRLDTALNETWATLPGYMMVRSLDECIGDTPHMIMQRFGLASLYQKSRCVLHRRYLAEVVPNQEHDYSRQSCLESALTLLDSQHTIWEACQPGHTLSAHGWFVTSLSMHDYLLAAMVIYLVIQNVNYLSDDPSRSWCGRRVSPSKEELKGILRRSHDIWTRAARDAQEMKKTAETLAVMLARVGSPVTSPREADSAESSTGLTASTSLTGSFWNAPTEVSASTRTQSANGGYEDGPTPYMLAQAMDAVPATHWGQNPAQAPLDLFTSPNDWTMNMESMDWRFLDAPMTQNQTLPWMTDVAQDKVDCAHGLLDFQDQPLNGPQ